MNIDDSRSPSPSPGVLPGSNEELAHIIQCLSAYGVTLRPNPKINHPTWIHLSTVNDDPAIPGPATLRRIAELLDQAAYLLEAVQRE